MNRDQKEEKYKRIIWRRSNCIIAWWWRHHFISRSSFSFNRRIELHRFVYLFEIEEFDWKERMYTIIMNIFVDCTTNCYIILIIQIVQNLFGFGMELKKSWVRYCLKWSIESMINENEIYDEVDDDWIWHDVVFWRKDIVIVHIIMDREWYEWYASW